jgi:aspartyl aminopeptidase
VSTHQSVPPAIRTVCVIVSEVLVGQKPLKIIIAHTSSPFLRLKCIVSFVRLRDDG